MESVVWVQERGSLSSSTMQNVARVIQSCYCCSCTAIQFSILIFKKDGLTAHFLKYLRHILLLLFLKEDPPRYLCEEISWRKAGKYTQTLFLLEVFPSPNKLRHFPPPCQENMWEFSCNTNHCSNFSICLICLLLPILLLVWSYF